MGIIPTTSQQNVTFLVKLLISLFFVSHSQQCPIRLQKQMKIMNRNLTGKLEEMNGMQNVDTHVALSGDFKTL